MDPQFDIKFNEAKQGQYLWDNLDTNHVSLSPEIITRLVNLVKNSDVNFPQKASSSQCYDLNAISTVEMPAPLQCKKAPVMA